MEEDIASDVMGVLEKYGFRRVPFFEGPLSLTAHHGSTLLTVAYLPEFFGECMGYTQYKIPETISVKEPLYRISNLADSLSNIFGKRRYLTWWDLDTIGMGGLLLTYPAGYFENYSYRFGEKNWINCAIFSNLEELRKGMGVFLEKKEKIESAGLEPYSVNPNELGRRLLRIFNEPTTETEEPINLENRSLKRSFIKRPRSFKQLEILAKTLV